MVRLIGSLNMLPWHAVAHAQQTEREVKIREGFSAHA